MTQEHFKQFWEFAKNWRPTDTKRPGAAAREFHRRVSDGVNPEEIVRGARIYTDHHLAKIKYSLSPHNWIHDGAWTEYQDEPAFERRLTRDEDRSYEEAFRRPPRTTDKPEGEWAGLPRLSVVS